jgi:hypothetical protein
MRGIFLPLALTCAGALALSSPARQAVPLGDETDASARYYFDHGAERYARDDIEKARAWVDEGLLLYPNDTKLILLRRLLEQPPAQQQSQQNQQPQSNGNDPKESTSESQGDEDSQSIAEMSQDSNRPQENEQRPAAAMTREEAERVLDTLRDREAAARARAAADRIRRDMARHPPVEKDW